MYICCTVELYEIKYVYTKIFVRALEVRAENATRFLLNMIYIWSVILFKTYSMRELIKIFVRREENGTHFLLIDVEACLLTCYLRPIASLSHQGVWFWVCWNTLNGMYNF